MSQFNATSAVTVDGHLTNSSNHDMNNDTESSVEAIKENKRDCYLNYNDDIIRDYDSSRRPIGIEYIYDTLTELKSNTHNNSLHVLEIACGSGNYLSQIAGKVSKAYGIDMNETMLENCRKKLKLNNVDAELVRACVPDRLPFADRTLDMVYNCQMLHHLSGGLKTIECFFAEVKRILKVNGIFVVNFTTKEQMDSYWYMDLIPKAKQICLDRCYTLDQICSSMNSVGLITDDRDIHVICDTMQKPKVYLDPSGPLSLSFRNGDSTWSKAEPMELKSAQEKVEKMLINGTAKDYVQERDKIRLRLGQSVTVVARSISQGD